MKQYRGRETRARPRARETSSREGRETRKSWERIEMKSSPVKVLLWVLLGK